MRYNQMPDDEPDAVVVSINVQAIADEDRLNKLRIIRDEVGDDGLTDEDLEFLGQYEADPAQAKADHDANLAEYLSEDDLRKIANEVVEAFDWDHESRKDWYAREVKGMRMLGVTSKVDGGANFPGASKAVHPLLAEACVQFQARTMSEVWPADGPVKTITVGDATDEIDQQAERVAAYMNYLMNDVMPGAYDADDMAYMRLPMSGSIFKKVYTDPIYGHMDDYVAPDDFVVPYNATDLRTAPRYTHVLFPFPNEVRRYQIAGHYRNVELQSPDERSLERVFYEEIKDAEGQTIWEREDDHRHTFLEQHVNWDLPGFEHKGLDGKPTGMELPYTITVDYDSREVLAIKRNWRENDPFFIKREWFIHKKFTPGFGFYGYGFFHWIGSLANSAIGALRALLDSAQFSNLPGGYRSRAGKALSGEGPVSPGEWRETELQPDELRNAFFALPYKEPSAVLFNLLGHLESLGNRFASTTDVMVGEGNNSVPVGTTLARIDQGQRIFSSIHKRIHRANRIEFKMLSEQIYEHMPEDGYPFSYQGVPRQIARQDFDSRVDILPISDPEIASSTQRIVQGQLLLDMATKMPQLYNLREVNRRALAAVRIQNIDEVLLPEDPEPPRRGPIEENMSMQTGKPVKARPDEDHAAHRIVHEQWFMGRQKADQDRLMPAYIAHQAEHAAWAYYIEMANAIGAKIPADVMGGEAEDMDPEMELQLSMAAAQAAQLLAQQPTPEQQAAEAEMQAAQMEEQRKDEVVAAEIRRKDQLVESEIRRKDALAQADIEREKSSVRAKALVDIAKNNQLSG